MATFFVQLADQGGRVLEYGYNVVVVDAEDAASARIAAERASTLDNADWANSTVTSHAPAADIELWTFRVVLIDPASGEGVAPVNDFLYTGAALDVLDDFGAGMAALANVPYTATWDIAPQEIILATGTGTDDLGDHLIFAGFFAPGEDNTLDYSGPRFQGQSDFMVGATDEGAAAANLILEIQTDAWVWPGEAVLARV